MTIRCELRKLMDKQGLTYRALAAAIGKTENYAANLHRFATTGKYVPGMDVIDRICEVLKCQPGDLLKRTKK